MNIVYIVYSGCNEARGLTVKEKGDHELRAKGTTDIQINDYFLHFKFNRH